MAQKYPKMPLNRDENDVKSSVVTVIVSGDANLDMNRLRIW